MLYGSCYCFGAVLKAYGFNGEGVSAPPPPHRRPHMCRTAMPGAVRSRGEGWESLYSGALPRPRSGPADQLIASPGGRLCSGGAGDLCVALCVGKLTPAASDTIGKTVV